MSDEDEIILADLDDEELVQQMFDDLYDGLREEIEEGVNILIARGWIPYDVLTKALVGGMTIVGADFRDGILFVPEVLLAANAMKGGMAILKPLLALWQTEAEIIREENVVVEALSEQYKKPRATKAYKEQTAHLDDARTETAKNRIEVEALIDAVEWPWQTDKGILVEGLDHSLETTRLGIEYLAELWPEPDIVGAEWHLTADLGNGYRVHGYIDRVENTSDGIEVVDYKSSRFHDTVLDHWLQAAVYSVIAEDHIGFAPSRVRLAYMRGQDS
ncbi:hypothetical protein LCGC14_0575940, partial [marine sediment metagenome]